LIQQPWSHAISLNLFRHMRTLFGRLPCDENSMTIAPDLLGPSALTALCLLPRPDRVQTRALFGGLRELAHATGALSLALAMRIAWLARQDPAALGHLTFTTFCRERIDWGASWRRALVRLVESPLDLVKQAAHEGAIPLRLAVQAPGRVAVADQAAWLLDAAIEEAPRARRCLEDHQGADADMIRRARRLARICLGRAATPLEVDAYLVACWRDRIPAEQILAVARETPGVPAEPEPLSWAWCAGESAPASIEAALAEVERLQDILRGRTAVMARAWMLVVHGALWRDGYESAEECAGDVLGLSLRQAQRLAHLGSTLEWYPEVDAAIRCGLPPRLGDRIGRAAAGPRVAAWLAVSERVGRLELDRALGHADPQTLAAYQQAIARVDADATFAGAQVALPHPDEARAAQPVRAPPGLLPAARWWVETVKIERRTGFQQVKDHDDYRCGNPECGRQTLRVEAHHLRRRSEGGSDALENGVAACRVCHLRGLHGGRLRADAVIVGGRSAIAWRWPDGRTVIAFRSEGQPVS
jgi:hypothetical protein